MSKPVTTRRDAEQRPSAGRLLWQVPFSVLVWSGGFGIMLATSMVLIPTFAFRSPKQQSLWAARAFGKVLDIVLGSFANTQSRTGN